MYIYMNAYICIRAHVMTKKVACRFLAEVGSRGRAKKGTLNIVCDN